MHSKVTGGEVTEPIPIRVGGVKISTVVLIGERRGGLACKIAKWMMGVHDCIWRISTAGFAEQNGRNAKLNGRITFDY